jgi:hypothetical protein
MDFWGLRADKDVKVEALVVPLRDLTHEELVRTPSLQP